MKRKPYRICLWIATCWAIACCFFGYRGGSLHEGNITGSTFTRSDWFFVFSHRSPVSESPLKIWSQTHQVTVSEKFILIHFSSTSVFGTGSGDGAQKPAIHRFNGYWQKDYLAHENEPAIRQFLTEMMAAPDEATRNKLVEKARQRTAELGQTFGRAYP